MSKNFKQINRLMGTELERKRRIMTKRAKLSNAELQMKYEERLLHKLDPYHEDREKTVMDIHETDSGIQTEVIMI